MTAAVSRFRDRPWGRALGRFRANGTAVAGLALIALILLLVFVYPPLFGRDPNAIDLLALNQPPGAAHPSAPTGSGVTCWRGCWKAAGSR
jgi:hypothetical protein